MGVQQKDPQGNIKVFYLKNILGHFRCRSPWVSDPPPPKACVSKGRGAVVRVFFLHLSQFQGSKGGGGLKHAGGGD